MDQILYADCRRGYRMGWRLRVPKATPKTNGSLEVSRSAQSG